MHKRSIHSVILVVLTIVVSCSSSDKFSGFSYDPEGSTITTDKEINPQHQRTIGISDDGIWLTNEYPGARMNDFYKIGESMYQVVLEPENAPINNSPWYSFKIWGDTSKTVKLKLSYEHGEHRYYPELSTDGKSWTPIDSTSYMPDTLNGTATLELNISQKPLWISAQELITSEDYTRWADSLSQKPYVTQDTVGYSHQKRPIKKLRINDVTESGPHGVLVITGRLHPPEVTGNIANLVFLEELASDTDLAKRFRQKFEVLAYPFSNPDGVQNGHWRHNAAGVDLNRDWKAFNQPETRAIRDDLVSIMKANPQKKVYYGIDFHSTDENIFYPINRDIKTFPEDFTYIWTDLLMASFPDQEFAVEPFDTTSPISKNWVHRTFGADAVTYEVNDRADRENLKAVSRKAARIIMRQLLITAENESMK